MKPTDVPGEVIAAESRIRPHIRETMLIRSDYLSSLGEGDLHLKLENLQHTGAFKVRGALNKVLSLDPSLLEKGVITASTGNHGAAVAFSLQKVKGKGIVFVPDQTPGEKTEAIERLGVEVRRFGSDCVDTEAHARRYAEEHGSTFVSPYNDPKIVAGQGTIGVELERQLDGIDAVFVAVGGGGLISGIGGYLKSIDPTIRIIGCSPENSQVMVRSVKAGKILDLPSLPTLSSATAGGLEAGAITFDLCRELVDEFITVTEEEIKESLRLMIRMEHMLVEGAAAVPLASYLKTRERFAGRKVVIIICGANMSIDLLKTVL